MIFKFCPPSQYSLDNLRMASLFCRHFEDFNDPFEFWSSFAEGAPDGSEPERLVSALAAWGFPDPSTAEPYDEYFKSLADGQPAFAARMNRMRIACLASDSTNLLMWSHYADGLRGFCIGFDEQVLVDGSDQAYLTHVEYLDEPPAVDNFLFAVAADQYDFHMAAIAERPRNEAYLGPDPITDTAYKAVADESMNLMKTLWRQAFAVKPREWQYEGEHRLLIETDAGDKSPFLHRYPRDAVRQIIVGERMPDTYRSQLVELVTREFPEARVLMAVRSKSSFAISFEDV